MDPTPDLTDICDVLNEASDTPAGTDFLPYAQRIKGIIIEALAQEADSDGKDGLSFCRMCDCGGMASDWLRSKLPEVTE